MKIGILGGGQLARMLCLAGVPLGMEFRVLDPGIGAGAAVIAEQVVAQYDDPNRWEEFVQGLDLVTYEFENVPDTTATWLAERLPVYPPPVALKKSQDRLIEKELLRSLGVATAPFVAVDMLSELEAAVEELGLPAVLKTRRFGYDGKGQYVLRKPEDVPLAWEALGRGKSPIEGNSNLIDPPLVSPQAEGEISGGQQEQGAAVERPLVEMADLILEGFVAFQREVSLVAVRGKDGETKCYPLVENHHREGILRMTLAPAPDTSEWLQVEAEEAIRKVMEALDYVGVLTIEFFERNGELIANEMAPRVHNSGHWTIEGAETSQFENHLRAIAGLPLGSTAPIGHSAMVNIIGTLPDIPSILSMPNAHLHLYGKEPRAGRKLGHITVRAGDQDELNGPLFQPETW